MVQVSDPSQYEQRTFPVRRDLLKALDAWAEDEEIGPSRVLEEILEVALVGWLPEKTPADS